jgi:enoyl-CoA hydratase
MVATMRSWLARWRTDEHVRVVVIDGAGEHGLSAGADIRELFDDAQRGARRTIAHWVDEYRLAADIASHPKPVVALMDGAVMGTGFGIAAHASHRIVNDDSVIAVPEVGVGLVPALGASFLLARAPGELGTHLALTADRLDAADALYCGVADFWIRREERSTLLTALSDSHPVDVLRALCGTPPYDSELGDQRPWIDACYSADRVEDILQRLRGYGRHEARTAADRIAGLSPTALKVSLRALREARSDASLEVSLRREFRVGIRMLLGHDALEGIRSQAVDRERVPTWQPSSLDEVSDGEVDAYFRPLGAGELDLDHAPSGS